MKYVLGTFLLLTTTVSFALDINLKPLNATQRENMCNTIKGMAEPVMMARQYGAPEEKYIAGLKQIKEKENTPEVISQLALAITERAYKLPIAKTPQGKKYMIYDFQNSLYESCIENKGLH